MKNNKGGHLDIDVDIINKENAEHCIKDVLNKEEDKYRKEYKEKQNINFEIINFKDDHIKIFNFIKSNIDNIFTNFDNTNNGVIIISSEDDKGYGSKISGGSAFQLKCIKKLDSGCDIELYTQLRDYGTLCRRNNNDINNYINNNSDHTIIKNNEGLRKLLSFIDENKKEVTINIDIPYTPHYKYSNCEEEVRDTYGNFITSRNYKYREYNKDIAEAYEHLFIENMNNMKEFIREQQIYIKNLDKSKKRIVQDYCRPISFKLYSIYINNITNTELPNKLYEFINNEINLNLIKDAFYKQINDFFISLLKKTLDSSDVTIKQKINDIIDIIDYNNWIDNDRLNETNKNIYKLFSINDWITILKLFIKDLDDIIREAPIVKNIIYCYRGSNHHYIKEGPYSFVYDDKNFCISDRIGSFTFDYDIANFFSGIVIIGDNCIYRTAIMPFTRVLYVAPLSSQFDECEILCPSDSIFIFKDKGNNSFNNLNIGNGLFSDTEKVFNSIDNVLYLTPQPETFDITKDQLERIITTTLEGQITSNGDEFKELTEYIFDINNLISRKYFLEDPSLLAVRGGKKENKIYKVFIENKKENKFYINYYNKKYYLSSNNTIIKNNKYYIKINKKYFEIFI